MQTDPPAGSGPAIAIDSIDPSKFAPIEEPDEGTFLVYLNSELVWTNKSEKHATVPFEELPLPSRDRARLDPCTVRFEFTGSFKNGDRQRAEWSILSQLKTFFRRFGIENAGPGVSFPTGVGRGKFVDITIGPNNLELLTKAPLSFNKQKLEITLVGPKLPPSTIILEILDVPFQVDAKSAAQTVAFKIHERQIGKVWDIWKVEHGLTEEFSDSVGRRQYSLVVVLVPTALPSGKIAATTIINIPGYISLHRKHSDAFRILHPTQPSFTRHHVVMGELLSSRRLDSIWISRDLLPALLATSIKSSPSDHAAVSVNLRTSSAAETRGPGTWRLHRDIHLRLAFAVRLQQFSAQLDSAISYRTAPI
ncbi:hypothetical protein NDA16_004628 [Ustilago loliicola]|nr:hypothetical protein NDA16_004628 [Ustilago loliicola]